MTSFRLPACATWERGGGLARLFGCGRREAATDCVARIWEEHDSVLSITSTPVRTNPSSFTTAALGPAHARGENSKPGRTIRPKVKGGLTTGACWAPRRFTGTRELLHGTLDPSLGAYVGLEGGARTWRLNTGPLMGSWKWMGATRPELAEPHGQFTGIDDLIACAASTVGPCGRHQGRQHAKTILVLAWRYRTVCRSLRIDLSGPHQAV